MNKELFFLKNCTYHESSENRFKVSGPKCIESIANRQNAFEPVLPGVINVILLALTTQSPPLTTTDDYGTDDCVRLKPNLPFTPGVAIHVT